MIYLDKRSGKNTYKYFIKPQPSRIAEPTPSLPILPDDRIPATMIRRFEPASSPNRDECTEPEAKCSKLSRDETRCRETSFFTINDDVRLLIFNLLSPIDLMFFSMCLRSFCMAPRLVRGEHILHGTVGKYVCYVAAYLGHLSVLKWLTENKYPWFPGRMNDQGLREFDAGWRVNMLSVFDFCKIELEPHHIPEKEISFYAVLGGSVECLEYVYENAPDERRGVWPKGIDWVAANAGRFECLKYIHETGLPWSDGVSTALAGTGDLESLTYVVERGCPWGGKNVYLAMWLSGKLDCLDYAISNRCPWIEVDPNTGTDRDVSCFLRLARLFKSPLDLQLLDFVRTRRYGCITSRIRLSLPERILNEGFRTQATLLQISSMLDNS